ncbi:uncharacterized protein LOC120271560 [Dioscorea cayenensis subsp. rotundata]|uniref:Uncharacterized protein LOC120271560 n=1 Tax=Dioscorea cayennensis subsp. rotundata TaxID=55577 RepID=A0AB40C3E8_DIOCR|nr:uncharacterized protein LOC120271560 [Dioscorea cayenensis subsp. rotundata]
MADKKKLLDNPYIKLQRLHHLAAIQVIMLVISWIARRKKEHKHVNNQIARELRLHGDQARDELMSHLLSSDLCHNMIRMSPRAFLGLCEILVRDGGLRPTLQVSIEEQVARTLYLLGHNVSHRELPFFFRRSCETISCHFHNVLQAIVELEEKYLVQPDGSEIPSEIFSSSRFYPYFKENITFVDAGFMLRSGLITPYRGERYHLKEYSRNPPRNPHELFNLRHASLRNSIERAFGVVKKRFPIIGSSTEPHYGLETQKEIIFACCILHNYLMGVDPDDILIAQVDNELSDEVQDEHDGTGENSEETIAGEIIRDAIAVEMWTNYVE